MAVGSIVDYLDSIGQDSSPEARKRLAEQNGITDYKGTADQNIRLLRTLQGGGSTASGSTSTGVPAAVASGGIETITDNTPGYKAPGQVGYAKYSGKIKDGEYTRSDKVNQLYDRAQSAAGRVEGMDWEPSDRLEEYADKLAEVEDNRPDPFQSKYTDTINSLLDSILNEKEFSYTGKDLMSDDLYKMYADQYEHNARKAMQDAMGNAQAMTGGYGSTYSQTVGQQTYDETMSSMNDIALQLADRAYERYLNDRANRYNQMGVVTGLDDTDYSRYRDTVGDWQADRDYYAGRYDNTFAQDYGVYRDQVADAQDIRDYYTSLYGTEFGNELAEWQANQGLAQWEQEYELAAAQDARDAEQWELQKQQIQQEMALAAAGGSSGGSSGRSSGSGKKNSSSEGGDERKWLLDISRALSNPEVYSKADVNGMIDEAYTYYKENYENPESQLKSLSWLLEQNEARRDED